MISACRAHRARQERSWPIVAGEPRACPNRRRPIQSTRARARWPLSPRREPGDLSPRMVRGSPISWLAWTVWNATCQSEDWRSEGRQAGAGGSEALPHRVGAWAAEHGAQAITRHRRGRVRCMTQPRAAALQGQSGNSRAPLRPRMSVLTWCSGTLMCPVMVRLGRKSGIGVRICRSYREWAVTIRSRSRRTGSRALLENVV